MQLGRRTLATTTGLVLSLGIALAPAAGAERCDTWYRHGHDPDGNRRSWDHSSPELDQNHGVVYVHNHTGHYVVRGQGWYVEVVGGGYYDGGGTGYTNQGGYVQAGLFPGALGVPVDGDVNANVNVFASGKQGGCVSVLGNKVGDPGQDPDIRNR
ncbi:MAG TPA: hypothetical protein VM840_03060 [Actinomycetota bacterium]|nr:hypothetical protein [Actinomycetota bacterium]